MKWLAFMVLSVGVCQADITSVESVGSSLVVVHGSGFGKSKATLNGMEMHVAKRSGTSLTLICKGAFAPPCKGHVIRRGQYNVELTNGDVSSVWVQGIGPANGSGGS